MMRHLSFSLICFLHYKIKITNEDYLNKQNTLIRTYSDYLEVDVIMQNTSLSQYRQSQIAATAPEKTVLMLYDGAIRFLKNAIREIDENNDIVAKANLIEKTLKILEYLQSCLDSDKGGEIAINLNKLYDYMSVRLTEANLKNDTAKMEEVLNLIRTIREGWNGICNKNGINNQTVNYEATAANVGGETEAVSRKDRKLQLKV